MTRKEPERLRLKVAAVKRLSTLATGNDFMPPWTSALALVRIKRLAVGLPASLAVFAALNAAVYDSLNIGYPRCRNVT